jgi:hypothetical protein
MTALLSAFDHTPHAKGKKLLPTPNALLLPQWPDAYDTKRSEI